MTDEKANQPEDDPKIVVDSDWKSQVQAERDQLRQQQGSEATSEPPPPESPRDEGPLPPASFATLVTTLAAQAMASLGHAPDPTTGKPVVQLEIARHFIDTLAVLEEKTKGNLDAGEAAMLQNMLSQLRMLFVQAKNSANNPETSGNNPN